MRSEGQPVPANSFVALRHKSSQVNLCSDSCSMRNQYGLEYEVTPPPFPSRFGRCVRPVSPHRPARQPKNLPGYCLQPTYIYFLRPESKGFTTHAIFAEAGYETSLKRL